MATLNPFDLLGDDTEDPSLLAAQQKIEPKKPVAPPAKQPAQNKPAAQPKLPSKPAPPAQAVRDAKSDSGRGGRGGGRGRGFGRGGGRDFGSNENSYGNREAFVPRGAGAPEDIDGKPSERRSGYGGPRGPYRGGRRGGFSNGEGGEGEREFTRRPFERRSGTGRGNELKREGSGRGNWGTQSDDLAPATEEVANGDEKNLNVEKPSGDEDVVVDGEKEVAKDEKEEKEPEEDKEMTLEEYEKLLEEKRKALLALKTEGEERKVDAKEFQAMQKLSNKKANDEIFVKLGSDKDKKKELAEKEEKAKKSVRINEFFKPAEGERYQNRGRRVGRGPSSGSGERRHYQAPAIEDPGQFPTLGGK